MKTLSKLGRIKDVAAAGAFCVAVTEKRDVFTWGYGLLGVGPEVQCSKDPIHIPPTLFGRNDFQPDNLVESVACGISHAVVSTSLGDLFSWGRNRSGCLGLGHEKDQYFPFKVLKLFPCKTELLNLIFSAGFVRRICQICFLWF